MKHLRPFVLIFAFVGAALWGISLNRLRISLIRNDDARKTMENQIRISYLTLVLEDLPQMIIVIFATSLTDKWNDPAQISLCLTVLAIIEKTFRYILMQNGEYDIQLGVFTSLYKRWFGDIEEITIAKLARYDSSEYPVFDENGEIIAHIGIGHVVKVLDKAKDSEWMKIGMIPNICNFFQYSVYNRDIVKEGWIQRHDDKWEKNFDFQFIEMDTKYKFVKQTEPQHMLVRLQKDGPNGDTCMKAHKWCVALVDEDSIKPEFTFEHNSKRYKYGKLKELPRVGAWSGEERLKKLWSALKNLDSGDDNWTIEAPVKPLTFWAESGLDTIAEAIWKMMQRKSSMNFAFQKQYNLQHLANQKESSWTPENTSVENLIALLTDDEHKLDTGTTVFHVPGADQFEARPDGRWEILTMKTNLGGDRSAKLISQQHDVVCVVLSGEEKATFWSLQAELEATTLEEIKDTLYQI